MKIQRLVVLVFGAIATWQWAEQRRRRLASQSGRRAVKPAEVATWEGEGGNTSTRVP